MRFLLKNRTNSIINKTAVDLRFFSHYESEHRQPLPTSNISGWGLTAVILNRAP